MIITLTASRERPLAEHDSSNDALLLTSRAEKNRQKREKERELKIEKQERELEISLFNTTPDEMKC